MPKGIPNAKPASSLSGYYYRSGEEGQFAIEVDAPAEGAITLTWKAVPDSGWQTAETIMPQSLFLQAIKAYMQDLADARNTNS